MLAATVATTNADKVRELAALLGGRLHLSAAPPAYAPPPETAQSYLENARAKARALHAAIKTAALADDSGLEVDALGGRPGLASARYGPDAPARVERLLRELRGRRGAERSARFRTVLVLVLDDGRELHAEGSCEGLIAETARGGGGFGYDPVFLVPALERTFGEIEAGEKDHWSARGAAARALLAALDAAGLR